MHRPGLTLALSTVGALGIAVAVSMPVVSHVRTQQAHRAAVGMLASVSRAQAAFRAAWGQGGYTTDLASLSVPCPPSPGGGIGTAGSPPASLLDPAMARDAGNATYSLVLRAARGAVPRGVDCFGRPIVSDYYVAAVPRRNSAYGQVAMAMRQGARIYVFFDRIPPVESDMSAGGLAVPLDTLENFRTP